MVHNLCQNRKMTNNCKKCKGVFCYHERIKGKEPRLNPMLVKTEECIDTLDRIVADVDLNDESVLKIAKNGISVDPLCFAAATGHLEGVKNLIKAGADPNKCFHGGESPLMIATRNRKTEVVEFLLKHGAHVKYADFEGFNSFMLAVLTGDAKLVNLLWIHRGKLLINQHNNSGFTALHMAADKSWESCVQFLLTNGACPNIKSTKTCTTPLMISAMKGDLGSAEKIVARGGNILQEDVEGMTAVCLAHDKGKEQIVLFLLSRITEQEKGDSFVKSRIERVRKYDKENTTEQAFMDIYTELFHTLVKLDTYKEILIRQKLIPNLLTIGQKFIKCENVVTHACSLICACLYRSEASIDEKFCQQFIRSRGPDFCIKAAKSFKEQGKRENDMLITCLFPIVCIAEGKEGKEWIQRNRSKVSIFSYLSEECGHLRCQDEHLQCRISVSWRKFWREIVDIEKEDREQNMMDLLEEEERERTKKAKKREKKRQKRMRAQQLKCVATVKVAEERNEKDVTVTDQAKETVANLSIDVGKTEESIQNEVTVPVDDKSTEVTDPNWTQVKCKKMTPKPVKSPQKWGQRLQKGNYPAKNKRSNFNSETQWSDMLKNHKSKSPTNASNTTTSKKENVQIRLDYEQEFPSLTHSSSVGEKVKGENSSISCPSEPKSAISDIWSSEDDQASGSLSGVTCDDEIPLWVMSESYDSDDTGSVHSYWERSLDFEQNSRQSAKDEQPSDVEVLQNNSQKKEKKASPRKSSSKSSPTNKGNEIKTDKDQLMNLEVNGGYDKSNHMADKDTKMFVGHLPLRGSVNVSQPNIPLTLCNVADSLYDARKSSQPHKSDNTAPLSTKKDTGQIQTGHSCKDLKEINNLYSNVNERPACVVDQPNIISLKGGRTLEEVEAELFQTSGSGVIEETQTTPKKSSDLKVCQKVAVIEPIGRQKNDEMDSAIINKCESKTGRENQSEERKSLRRLADMVENVLRLKRQAEWSLGIREQIALTESRREASDRKAIEKEEMRKDIHSACKNPFSTTTVASKYTAPIKDRREKPPLEYYHHGKDHINAGLGNCLLGESILRNALSIQHIPSNFSNISDLNLEEGDGKRTDAMFGSFPSVHDEDSKRNEDEKFEMAMKTMQQLQKQHLENYALSKGNGLMAGDGPGSDLQYYACCAGVQTKHDTVLGNARLQNGIKSNHNSDLVQTGRGWPKYFDQSLYPEQCSPRSASGNVINKTSLLTDQNDVSDLKNYLPGDILLPDTADSHKNERCDIPQRMWTPHSKRWREKLTELWNLPPEWRAQIGNIVLPCDKSAFSISYSHTDATLGFLADGTEVAVITMKRDCLTSNFEELLSPRYDNTFLARYKSFATEGDTCFVALELFEYTLAEFVNDPTLNDQVHDLTKWTWQILKGIAALHNTCDSLHGNIMPCNTLVDVDGRIRLSDYGLPVGAASDKSLLWKSSFDEDRKCWISTEVTTETEQYSAKSDIQVAGMLIHYLLTRGRHPYGENSMEISLCIQQNWHRIQTQNSEANDLIFGLLTMPPSCRPTAIDSLRHPYFWAAEKKLRLVLIAGSDVLRDMKLGGASNNEDGKTMIEILGTAGDVEFSNWTNDVDSVIMKEMRAFRQYKNTLVELVLFVYNCCLHFEKLPPNARDVIDEPCRYFLGRFPVLCLAVYRAIQRTDRVNKICYKPFF